MNVFVNGKRVVATVVNLNVDEGWVEVEDPSVLKDVLDIAIKPDVDPFQPYSIELPVKRLYGKVEVKMGREF